MAVYSKRVDEALEPDARLQRIDDEDDCAMAMTMQKSIRSSKLDRRDDFDVINGGEDPVHVKFDNDIV